jgi:ABC-type branched-subunit amino acid transport system permease subunit
LRGGLAGIARAFYGHYILFIGWVAFPIAEPINILVMVIFGGATTVADPTLGIPF